MHYLLSNELLKILTSHIYEFTLQFQIKLVKSKRIPYLKISCFPPPTPNPQITTVLAKKITTIKTPLLFSEKQSNEDRNYANYPSVYSLNLMEMKSVSISVSIQRFHYLTTKMDYRNYHICNLWFHATKKFY